MPSPSGRSLRYNSSVTKSDELIDYLFTGQAHPLAGELTGWMQASPRFSAFLEVYRDKVRKKFRVTREPESVLDVRGELEVAYHLLADRRLEVAYEPYASARRRGPDFAVTYRANRVFNIEVARVRVQAGEAGAVDISRKEERIVRVLVGKLGQMQPGMANLLAIHTPAEVAQRVDLGRLMGALKLRAERRDPDLYAAGGYTSPADFYSQFLHLSGIVLWATGAPHWVNRQARPALEEKIVRLVSALAGGGKSADERGSP